MIQFNLLPDIKIDYIKAAQTKRLAITVASIVIGVVLGAVSLTALTVTVVQKKSISDLDGDIKKYSQELANIPDINKILTIQNQLNSLPALHEQKPIASRMFKYIVQLTPTNVTFTNLSLNLEEGNINVEGQSPAISNINQFADTLKFTKYEVEGEEGQENAFTEVVLSSFSKNESNFAYKLSFKYDPAIFYDTKKIKLVVPSITTTRSEVEKPAALFESEEQ